MFGLFCNNMNNIILKTILMDEWVNLWASGIIIGRKKDGRVTTPNPAFLNQWYKLRLSKYFKLWTRNFQYATPLCLPPKTGKIWAKVSQSFSSLSQPLNTHYLKFSMRKLLEKFKCKIKVFFDHLLPSQLPKCFKN